MQQVQVVAMENSYFNLTEWGIILLMALVSALINIYIPVKAITQGLNIPGPAAGMALFGGLIFVLWASLSRKITRKKYAGLTTAVIIACFCLFVQPWYGVTSPSWFSVYGILSLFALGLWIELLQGKWAIVGGGLGNLSCLVVTWLALGFHPHVWVPARFAPFLLLAAFISGMVGELLAQGIATLAEEMRF